LWQQVNVETMELECKKLVAEIRALDKETRAWEAFNGVDSKVKNMITSLSAVGLLQSPAIRDRHWQQVMNTTGVRIVMSDKTTLADLLALNLHEFEDEVSGIVDRANKEQGMEKNAWAAGGDMGQHELRLRCSQRDPDAHAQGLGGAHRDAGGEPSAAAELAHVQVHCVLPRGRLGLAEEAVDRRLCH